MTDLRALTASDLAGRSLRDAFRLFVLSDDAFFSACHMARQLDVGGYRPASTLTAMGMFPSFTGLWPVHVGRADLARRWLDPDASTHGHLMTSVYPGRAETVADAEAVADGWVKLEAYAHVVGAVLARFLAPLRSGEVVAYGDVAGARLPISRAWWDRDGSRIDPDNGDLCRVVETGFSVDEAREPRGAREQENIAVEWLSVTFDVSREAQNDGHSPNRGRTRQYSYDKGMGAVLNLILRYGLPNTGNDLCKMLERELLEIDRYSPDLRRLAQDIAKRDETLWKAVARRPPK